MVELKTKLNLIQEEIDKIKSGHCMLIKVNNYDQLCAVIDDIAIILSDLNKIVHNVCSSHKIKISTIIERNKIFCTLSRIEQFLLKQVVFEIYYHSQLYTNFKIPSAFLSCYIVTINFSESKNAKEIYSSLAGMLTHFNSGGYYQEYNDEIHNLGRIKESIKELNLLRNSLSQKTMKFAYQPIVNSKNGKTLYYECLLRVPNQDNELISVGPIIESAEATGLINIVDFIVLEMAVKELVKSPDITLSINISNSGIIDQHLLDLVEKFLTENNVAHRLIIEITETAFNKDYHKTKKSMDHLHSLGCRFAIDDFGSGFTSFKQLQNLPIDIIKIDGSYIKNINNNHFNQYLVESLVRLSEALGIKTVAEFVENKEVAKYLIDIKVDCLQGNFFSPASILRK